jgi:hypothetical protein
VSVVDWVIHNPRLLQDLVLVPVIVLLLVIQQVLHLYEKVHQQRLHAETTSQAIAAVSEELKGLRTSMDHLCQRLANSEDRLYNLVLAQHQELGEAREQLNHQFVDRWAELARALIVQEVKPAASPDGPPSNEEYGSRPGGRRGNSVRKAPATIPARDKSSGQYYLTPAASPPPAPHDPPDRCSSPACRNSP